MGIPGAVVIYKKKSFRYHLKNRKFCKVYIGAHHCETTKGLQYDHNGRPLMNQCPGAVSRSVAKVATHPSFQCIPPEGCKLGSFKQKCYGKCKDVRGSDISVMTLNAPVAYSDKIRQGYSWDFKTDLYCLHFVNKTL